MNEAKRRFMALPTIERVLLARTAREYALKITGDAHAGYEDYVQFYADCARLRGQMFFWSEIIAKLNKN